MYNREFVESTAHQDLSVDDVLVTISNTSSKRISIVVRNEGTYALKVTLVSIILKISYQATASSATVIHYKSEKDWLNWTYLTGYVADTVSAPSVGTEVFYAQTSSYSSPTVPYVNIEQAEVVIKLSHPTNPSIYRYVVLERGK